MDAIVLPCGDHSAPTVDRRFACAVHVVDGVQIQVARNHIDSRGFLPAVLSNQRLGPQNDIPLETVSSGGKALAERKAVLIVARRRRDHQRDFRTCVRCFDGRDQVVQIREVRLG